MPSHVRRFLVVLVVLVVNFIVVLLVVSETNESHGPV